MGETWRVLERIVWWGMVYSKISNRKIYINTPHFTLKFLGCYIPGFGSSGSLTLFFLGLPGGFLRCGGFIGGSPVLAHIVLTFIGKIILS